MAIQLECLLFNTYKGKMVNVMFEIDVQPYKVLVFTSDFKFLIGVNE